MSDPSMADDLKGEPPEPEADDKLTLRDRFALAALPALLQMHKEELVYEDLLFDDIAVDAYNCADALLAIRSEHVERDGDEEAD